MERNLPCSFVTSGMPPAGTTRSNTRLLRARFAPSPSSSIARPTASFHAEKSGMNATDLLRADCNISLLNELAVFLIPQHGISAVWRRGHQYLYAERNSHEPKRVRSGIYALKPVCGHSLNSCGCVHCALGNSQNIRHRFGADSCWRPVAFLYRF